MSWLAGRATSWSPLPVFTQDRGQFLLVRLVPASERAITLLFAGHGPGRQMPDAFVVADSNPSKSLPQMPHLSGLSRLPAWISCAGGTLSESIAAGIDLDLVEGQIGPRHGAARNVITVASHRPLGHGM